MKKTIFYAALLSFLLIHNHLQAQYRRGYAGNTTSNELVLGIGAGLDYGALGGKFSYYPMSSVGVFCGIGTSFIDIALNAGAIVKMLPEKRVCPFITAFYGHNGFIKIIGNSQYDKQYTGATFGGGIQLRGRSMTNFFSFGLLLPIRSESFEKDWNIVSSNPSINIVQDPPPLLISLGYNFSLNGN